MCSTRLRSRRTKRTEIDNTEYCILREEVNQIQKRKAKKKHVNISLTRKRNIPSGLATHRTQKIGARQNRMSVAGAYVKMKFQYWNNVEHPKWTSLR